MSAQVVRICDYNRPEREPTKEEATVLEFPRRLQLPVPVFPVEFWRGYMTGIRKQSHD